MCMRACVRACVHACVHMYAHACTHIYTYYITMLPNCHYEAWHCCIYIYAICSPLSLIVSPAIQPLQAHFIYPTQAESRQWTHTENPQSLDPWWSISKQVFSLSHYLKWQISKSCVSVTVVPVTRDVTEKGTHSHGLWFCGANYCHMIGRGRMIIVCQRPHHKDS